MVHATVFRVRFSLISSLSLKQLRVGHVFFRFGISGLQELVEAEEFAAEGAAVGGPFGFAGIDGQSGAGGGEFRIEIVEIVEDQSFADHGQLRRAEFVLAMVADEEMLNDGLQVWRETFDGVHGFGDGFKFHHDVAEELAFDGVADSAFVAEFVELADIVEHRRGEKKIDVQLGIVRGSLLGEPAQTEDVLDEAAEKRMVHDFGGGGALVLRGDCWIRNDAGDEFVQPGISDGSGEFLELREKLFDIFLGVRQKIGEVDLFGFREAKLQQRKLGPVAVDFNARVYLDEIVAADVLGNDVELIPHARFDGAAAIAKLEAEIGFAFAGVATFFFVNEEKRSDGLFGVEIGDERRLHLKVDAEPERLPKSRNFLCPFLLLVTSGVALTS